MRLWVLTSMLCVLTASALAQWEPDVRLTNDPANSFLANPNNHGIVAIGDSIHVVFTDNRTGGYQVYYMRSTDDGNTWDDPVMLSNDAGGHIFNASLAASGATVHVAWPTSASKAIMYRRSTDAGATWSAEESLIVTTGGLGDECLAADGNAVGLVWADDRDGSRNGELYLKRSNDGGQNWGADTRLTFSPDTLDKEPCLAIAGNAWHLVWTEYSWSTYRTLDRYQRSTDAGASWLASIPVTQDTTSQTQPEVAAVGPDVHVCWGDGRPGAYGIYYHHSNDNGATWSAEQSVSDSTRGSDYPCLAAGGGNVYATFRVLSAGHFFIAYTGSTDNGQTWSTETLLTTAEGLGTPLLAAVGSRVHVVLYDNRDGNFELYYKRNLAAGGIEEGRQPTAMNPRLIATIVRGTLIWSATTPSLRNVGDIGLHARAELLDASGRRVMKLEAGPNDVSRFAPGVYFIRGRGARGE